MALSRTTRQVIGRYGHQVDDIAAQYTNPITGKRLSGAALLAKLIQGESGDDPNADSGKAHGRTQFTPASRDIAVRKYGIDPWRSTDEAVHAAVLHLQGKINGSKGLEGYNPGDSSYPSYILGQRVGKISGGRSSSGAGSAPSTSGATGTAPASSLPQSASLGALSGLLAPQPQPVPVTPPQAPAFSATQNLHDPRIGSVPSSGPPAAPQTDLRAALAQLTVDGTLPPDEQAALPETGGSAAPGGKGGGRGIHLNMDDGWQGAHSVAIPSVRIGSKYGLGVSSRKRDKQGTATGGVSDHYVGKKNAWAYDLSNGQGEDSAKLKAAKELAKFYGVTFRKNSYQSGGTIKVGGHKYRVQILFGAGVDHADHVHIGFERVG